MFLCASCKATFENPHEEREYHDEIPGNFYESFYSCPVCGSGDYSEATECDECGEYIPKGKLLCEGCKKMLLNAFNNFVSDLTEVQKEVLMDMGVIAV